MFYNISDRLLEVQPLCLHHSPHEFWPCPQKPNYNDLISVSSPLTTDLAQCRVNVFSRFLGRPLKDSVAYTFVHNGHS